MLRDWIKRSLYITTPIGPDSSLMYAAWRLVLKSLARCMFFLIYTYSLPTSWVIYTNRENQGMDMWNQQNYGRILLRLGFALYSSELTIKEMMILSIWKLTLHVSRSDDCRPGTEVIFIKAGNGKVNIRHNDNVRSVYCLGTKWLPSPLRMNVSES